MNVEVRPPTPEDAAELLAFFLRVPAGERTFFKEENVDAETVGAWLAPGARGRRAIAVTADGQVVGHVAVVPLPGWSDHVGELRLIVDPDHRRQGLGRTLARRALIDAIECQLRRLVVEVVAEQDGTVAMFEALGFRPEALLQDHVRDRDGGFRDLIVLAQSIEDQQAAMAVTGIDEALR
jgi:L-amino acid N-acyltransferase YncA